MKSAEFRVKKGRVAAAEAPARKRSHARIEDRLDIAAAKKALAESAKLIPYETVRKQLGLKRRPVRPPNYAWPPNRGARP